MSNKNKKVRPSQKSVTTVAVVTKGQAATGRPKKKRGGGGELNLIRDGYLATLVNPFGVHGMRIPDIITAPSAVCTLRYRTTITAVKHSTKDIYAAGFVFTPTIKNGLQGIASYSGVADTIFFGGAVSFSQTTTLNNLCREYRVVSAGLGVFNTTAMASNQGRNICAFYPGSDTLGVTIGTDTTTANLLQSENVEDSPLNANMVCSLVWSPSDPSNFEYHSPGAFAAGNTSFGPLYYNPGQLVWVADGVSSTASFEVICTVNVEFQPNTNAIDFFPTLPSRYDVGALMNAMNSPLVTRRFGTVQPQDIMVTQSSNNFGLSSIAGQLLNNFGNGARDVLLPVARRLGSSLAYAATLGAMNHLRRRNSPNVRNAILGIPAGL